VRGWFARKLANSLRK
jgi:hypothetical protein